jgi:peroxiredoxin
MTSHSRWRSPHSRSSRRTLRAGISLAVSLALVGAVSGCAADDSLAQQAQSGDNKNYIAGDGSVTEYSPDARGEALELTATLYDGTTIDAADWKGQVTVLNIWYAACAPCRVEAPELQSLHQEYQAAGVQFYGVNIRDEQATAEAFERNFGITYPSVNDKDGGMLLALTQYVPPQAVPSTLVLDKQGRVSGRIIGLAEKSTLEALISDAAAEQ